jgi:hypothetical protein
MLINIKLFGYLLLIFLALSGALYRAAGIKAYSYIIIILKCDRERQKYAHGHFNVKFILN